MEYTYQDVMEKENAAKVKTFEFCLDRINSAIPTMPTEYTAKKKWETDTLQLRAVRGDIMVDYLREVKSMQYYVQEKKEKEHKEEIARLEAIIEKLEKAANGKK